MASRFWTQTQAPAGNWTDHYGTGAMQPCINMAEHLIAKEGEKARVVERVDTVVWPNDPMRGVKPIYSVSPPKGKRGVSVKDDKGRHIYYVASKSDIAIKGDVILVGERDTFWGGKQSKEYRSGVLHNPTWGDVFEHFGRSMPVTRDLHHAFLEGVYPIRRDGKDVVENGIPLYVFVAGS